MAAKWYFERDEEKWRLFAELESAMIDHELDERDKRLAWLDSKNAIWNGEGRFWSYSDEKGKDWFFDEDGYSM